MRSYAFALAAVVAGLCLSALPAWGQGQPITIRGRILGIQGFLVTVQGEAGPIVGSLDPSRVDGGFRIQMPPPKIEINGTASLESLEKGVMVRFNVELDNRKPVGEVTELTIVGLDGWTEAAPGLVPEGMIPEVPGINEEGPRQPKLPPPTTGKFTAVGTVTSFKAGVLNLAYGSGRAATVQAKVADTAQVKIESHDPRMIRNGDMAMLEGATGRPGRMFVGTLAVTRDANLDKPAKPMKPMIAKPERKPKGPDKNADPAVAEAPAEAAPAPMPEGPPRPKTKGKPVTIN